MKYFTILILILVLSFFYVAMIDTDDSEIEIRRIQLVSEIDTNFIADIPNTSFLKNINIDPELYVDRKNSLFYDSLEYISNLIDFKDSLVFAIDKDYRKSNIYVEFYSFSSNGKGNIIVKSDEKVKNIEVENSVRKHRVHVGEVRSNIIVIKNEDTEIFNLRMYRSVRPRWDRKKKKSIVIFDIAGLQDSLINDTISFPFFSKMKERSKCFVKTQLLSSNRSESKLSLLKCLYPYLILDDNTPFKREKHEIMSSLRNSSMPEIYENSGYNTFYYGIKINNEKEFSEFFNNSSIFTDGPDNEIQIIQKFDNDINENKDAENFYYIDMNAESQDKEYYLKSVDSYLKELFFHIKSKVDMNDYIFVFLSTSSEKIYDPMLTMFFSENSIDSRVIDSKLDMTDISKTILSYSKLKIPYYFEGENLATDNELEEKINILGSDTDTLMFYNNHTLFKKYKYSDEYEIIHIKENEDMDRKEEDVAFEYNKRILENYTGDYVKYIILRNDSEQPKLYNLKISSKNRFIQISNIENYYTINKTHRRYEDDIRTEVKPFYNDTLKLFYRNREQTFSIKFDKSNKLAYGALGINAGVVKDFYEESEFGIDHTVVNKQEVFRDYDVKIFNRRINF